MNILLFHVEFKGNSSCRFQMRIIHDNSTTSSTLSLASFLEANEFIFVCWPSIFIAISRWSSKWVLSSLYPSKPAAQDMEHYIWNDSCLGNPTALLYQFKGKMANATYLWDEFKMRVHGPLSKLVSNDWKIHNCRHQFWLQKNNWETSIPMENRILFV